MKNKIIIGIISCFILSSWLLLEGCSSPPPNNPDNVCKIFTQYPEWYWAAKDAQKKWGVPISVQMAIIHQESRYQSSARPERERLLWVIPWKRPTSAYGYSQAVDGTWADYERSTGQSGSRNDFYDATDFIGWYGYQAHKKLGINRGNAEQLYLAYHEGMGGYKRGSYKKKAWLMNVAKKVKSRAYMYHRQLLSCQKNLATKPWWHVW